MQDLKAKFTVSVDGKRSEYDWNEKIESYIFWKIDPNEILEITQPDIKESEWNGQKTQG